MKERAELPLLTLRYPDSTVPLQLQGVPCRLRLTSLHEVSISTLYPEKSSQTPSEMSMPRLSNTLGDSNMEQATTTIERNATTCLFIRYQYEQIINLYPQKISKESMDKVKQTVTKQMCYLGACIWQGQKIEGVEKTPDILRQAKLFEGLHNKFAVEVIDLGNVSSKDWKQEKGNPEQETHFIRNLPLLDSLLGTVNEKIVEGLKGHPESVVVTVGGDHSVGSATIHGLNTHHKDLKVIWVDAHPDFIDPSKSTYNGYHGYPAGHACGLSKSMIPGFKWLQNTIPYENIVLLAIRDIDPDEWVNLKKHNIKCFTMDHVLELGIGETVRQAINYLDPEGNKPFHISFDVDAIEPVNCFATGTKFRGGLRPIEANYIVRKVAHTRRLVGLDVVEINPALETEEARHTFRGEEPYGLISPTVGLGIDLIESVFTEYFTL